jgi:hypothetical protein
MPRPSKSIKGAPETEDFIQEFHTPVENSSSGSKHYGTNTSINHTIVNTDASFSELVPPTASSPKLSDEVQLKVKNRKSNARASILPGMALKDQEK